MIGDKVMIDKKTMIDRIYQQLAIDYNCQPNDFLKDGIIFTEAIDNKDRRPFPWRTPRLEMISMGKVVVVNASTDILLYIIEQLKDKTRDEVFCMPFVYGISPYYLPDIERLRALNRPSGYEYELVEQTNIPNLFQYEGFRNAISYDVNRPRPDMLVALARFKNNIVGMAGASKDCKNMWQIGVDVLAQHRGNGLATALVNMLAIEVLNRGFIPYYATDSTNVLSQRVAIKSGFIPTWVHTYKTRFDGFI